ncbi:MAG: presenilin family intramembrane aspartyl protease PSH [Archaeoglobaceae archaeon]|nr:presenilin family intramembrane aspartyl protease [Archaeoglobaceae archaeon]MDW7990370.1 presenilin family intramembrane aspartyl protease PSH [Archaeoglobaceae archaeon]
MRLIFAAIFLLVNFFSIFSIKPYESAGMVVFENPEEVSNSLLYFLLILIFTAFVLIIARTRLLSAIIYILTFIAMFYVLIPFFELFSFFISAIITILIIKKPNWIILNLSAFLLSSGIATMFGISLSPIPAVFLLVILAIYDAISVYKTKHMINLAESVSKINAPMLFVIPKGNEKAMIGVGDIVMPAILAVSAQKFLLAPEIFSIKFPALFTIFGGFFGLLILIYIVEKKGGAHAGLPFINSGAIAGFAISNLILN